MNNYVTNANAMKLMSAIGTNIKDTKITATANSEDIALTDSADARVHDLKIYGKTENGHSVGENGLTVTACGKNLFNINGNVNMTHRVTGGAPTTDTWYEDTGESSRSTVENGILTSNRNSSTEYMDGQVITVQSGKSYVMSATVVSLGTATKAVMRIENFEFSFRYTKDTANVGDRISARVTIPEGTNEVLLCFGGSGGKGAQFTNIQLEQAITVSAYEPYYGNSLLISSALPLRRKMLTVDLGDFDWEYKTEHTYESGITFNRFATLTTAEGMFDPTKFTDTGNVKEDGYLLTQESCSGTYTVSSAPGAHEPIIDKTIIMSRKGRIYVVDNSYTDPAEFKAAVTGITLTYPSYCDEIDLADGVAITRLDSNGDVLATPVTTPLTTAEKAAFEAFRTFEGATNLTVTDNPFVSMTYVKNSDSGKALANVDDRIKETDISGKVDKVAGKGLSTEDYTTAEKTKLASLSPITISSTLTLTVAGWDSQTKQQTVLTTVDTTKRNVVDITVSELPTWSECNVYAISESATGVTFQCDTIPEDDLTFKITSMVVTSNA